MIVGDKYHHGVPTDHLRPLRPRCRVHTPATPSVTTTAIVPAHHVFHDSLLGLWAVIAHILGLRMASTWFAVGTTFTWTSANTTNWATTSGGTGGAGVPVAGDTAIFDSHSPSATTDATVPSLGGLTLNTGFTNTVTFGAAFTTTGTVTHIAGTLNTNSETCTWVAYSNTGTATRTLTMGSSAIAVSGTGTPWSIASTTGMTLTANTATITFSGAGITITTAVIANYSGTSFVINSTGTVAWSSGTTVANLTHAPTSGVANILSLGANITVGTTFTPTGAAAPDRVLVQSNTLGTQRTITCNGSVAITYCDFQDIKGAGTASWATPDASGWGDCRGNSGITFTTTQTNYYKAAANANWSVAGNWYLATNGGGGAGRVPLPQDTAVFDGNSGAHIYTQDFLRFGALTCTGFTGTFNGVSSGFAVNCYGNFTIPSGMTWTRNGSPSISFLGRGSQTFSYAATGTFGQATWFFNSIGGTYTVQADFAPATTGPFNLLNGTLVAGTQNITIISMNASSGTTISGGNWTLTRNSSGQAWGGYTVTNAPNVTINGTASGMTFVSNIAGSTYGTLTIAGASGVTISTASGTTTLTLAGITCTSANAALTFTHGSTYTISSASGWNVNGTIAGDVTITSDSAGNQWTLSCASGLVSSTYISLKDSAATGGATFEAVGPTSTFVSNVSGWALTYTASSATMSAVFGASATAVTVVPTTASVASTFLASATAVTDVLLTTGTLVALALLSASAEVIVPATGILLASFNATGVASIIPSVPTTGTTIGYFRATTSRSVGVVSRAIATASNQLVTSATASSLSVTSLGASNS